MANTIFNKIFRDTNGNIIIVQPPNLPLIVWLLVKLLEMIFTTGNVKIGLEALAFGALFTWAWQELFEGVNYFRKMLGFGVIIAMLASKIYL